MSEPTTPKKVRFTHRWEHAIVTIEAQKLGRIDGETKAGVHAQFYGHVYETDDQKIIDELKKGPSFGVDYWVYDADKPSPNTAKPHAPTPDMMPSEKEAHANPSGSEKRLKTLEVSLESLAKSVTLMAAGQEGLQQAVTGLADKVETLLESVEPAADDEDDTKTAKGAGKGNKAPANEDKTGK